MQDAKVIDATPKDHGECALCGKEAELVDGFLCEKCFKKQMKE